MNINSIIDENDKFKNMINDPNYSLTSTSIMVYYNSDMASISYIGEYSTPDLVTKEIEKTSVGGFFKLKKSLVKDLTGKQLTSLLN